MQFNKENYRLSYRQHGRARAGLLLFLIALLTGGALAAEEQRKVPDTYTAVTANMNPANVEIKADVLQWSTPEQRAAVIDALAEEDAVAALAELPTLGVVWRSGSAVGHAIKYAHRATAADGRERITLVTDKVIGGTSFRPWQANEPVESELAFSVVELIPAADGGEGTMSFAAEVLVDASANTIVLERGNRGPLLTDVVLQPKPYWAGAD